MKARKAFTLMETMMVVFTGGLLTIGVAAVFKTFTYEIPRNSRTANESATVLNMVERLREDVGRAVDLPGSFGAYSTDENTLLIALPGEGAVCYRIGDSGVQRLELRGESETLKADWSLPHSHVEWRIRRQGDRAVAVELSTYVAHSIRNHVQKKFANSHVFFLNTFAKAVITQ